LVTVVDPSQSSSLTVIAQGAFNITYVTPHSGVTGDYIADNFALGGTTIQNLTMGVATNAAYVPTGIMGIGFDTGESIVSSGGKPYNNIIDVMVQQKIINTRAYSLWLDDLGMFIRTRLGNLTFSICYSFRLTIRVRGLYRNGSVRRLRLRQILGPAYDITNLSRHPKWYN
jgi:hypothetical protein